MATRLTPPGRPNRLVIQDVVQAIKSLQRYRPILVGTPEQQVGNVRRITKVVPQPSPRNGSHPVPHTLDRIPPQGPGLMRRSQAGVSRPLGGWAQVGAR